MQIGPGISEHHIDREHIVPGGLPLTYPGIDVKVFAERFIEFEATAPRIAKRKNTKGINFVFIV